jgi:hypothetical protein
MLIPLPDVQVLTGFFEFLLGKTFIKNSHVAGWLAHQVFPYLFLVAPPRFFPDFNGNLALRSVSCTRMDEYFTVPYGEN